MPADRRHPDAGTGVTVGETGAPVPATTMAATVAGLRAGVEQLQAAALLVAQESARVRRHSVAIDAACRAVEANRPGTGALAELGGTAVSQLAELNEILDEVVTRMRAATAGYGPTGTMHRARL